nr:hypothetical protein [Tanacetum cinerariifolium]
MKMLPLLVFPLLALIFPLLALIFSLLALIFPLLALIFPLLALIFHTACAYIASQSSGSQIKFEDINQLDEYDMEGMDIKWSMALLSIRAAKFWKKTRKKISIQGSDVAGFDKSKVECFNCHKMGHFDLFWIGLLEFADDTVTDYSRPSPTMESTSGNDQNKNPSISEIDASPSTITPKPFIKFVKPNDSPSKSKTGKTKTPKKPPVKKFPTANNFFSTGGTKFSTADMGKKGKAGSSQNNIDDKGYWDSGCSRHMTGNISYLSDYEPFNGGYMSFGQGGYKITGKGTIKTGKLKFENVYFVKDLKYNLFSVSQICDNKNSVLFTDSECIVLERDFKLLDDANILLRTPRQHNMYSIDLNNIVPHKDLTCLVAKASADECMLWHRRVGHLNFKTMSRLVRHNLVRGLPSKCFENDHTCTACLKGKQHKASCKSKLVNSVFKPLHTLHMDLFGPTSVSSISHKWYCLVVTDDFSRFTWTFCLKTMDDTSGILKKFITEIENLKDLKVKFIRCDNGGEFKNKEMNDFCLQKGIKREFSNAKTPQQNGVAERRNTTLIEVARTMLVDAKLPVTFWAEAINTTCYVQNRVLVNNSHNKTPYELFNGRSPAIGFLKPFGCHVLILNTLDNLGKRVEENLYVEFLENKAIEKGGGPNWLFDIDSLTKSMNYVPVDAGTNSTNLSGTKDATSQEVKKDVSSLRYIALPNWVHDALLESSSSKPQDDCSTEVPENSGNPNPIASTSNPPADQIETLIVKSPIPTLSSPVLTACSTDSQEPLSDTRLISKRVANQVETPSLDNILTLTNRFEDILGVTTNSDESNGVEADVRNMETTITASPTPTLRIHKDHPKSQIIGPMDTPIQTRNKSKEPPGFQDPEFSSKVYKVEKAMYGLHQAPRAWYGTLSKYLLTHGFQMGTIDQTLFIRRQRGDFILVQVYMDDIIFGSSNAQLCKEFKALMHDKFQISAMGELNFFHGLQVLQKKDCIFLFQDKYVGDILKKFGYSDTIVATSTTEAEYVAAASCCGQVLWIQNQLLDYGLSMPCKALSREISTSILRFLRLIPLGEHNVNFHPIVDFVEASALSPSFSGKIVPLFDTMLVPQGEGSGTPTKPHHTPSLKAQHTSHTTHSSPTIPSVTTAPIPPVTSSDTPPIRQYTRRTKIAQSLVLPPVADEPTSPLRDVSQAPRVTSHVVAEGRAGNQHVEGRNLDEDEVAAERVSDDTEEMATVLISMDASTVLASRVAVVPTGSGSIPIVGPPVAEVPTGSDVVPTASPVFATATVVARDLEEQLAREDQRMSEQVARDAEIARIHAEEELYQDNYAKVYKFQTQQRRPWSKKQKRDYYMVVIKSNLDFIPMGSREEAGRLKRKGLSLEQQSMKKLKTSEEVTEEAKSLDEVPKEKVKEMMQVVSIEEVYVEALQVKHPIIDWKVHTEGRRSYWKIIRLGGSSAIYQFFMDLTKHMDREDLNQLWALVKESLSNRLPTSEKEMELWVKLKRLYEPDNEDQLWTHTQNLMHAPVEWKLYDMCGVHQVTYKDKEFFMLVEKDYPLRKGLALVMICYKLQVENYSQMANDLILKIYKIANCPSQQVIEFPLVEEVPTASEENCHCQKKREATAKRIALLVKV